MEQKPPGARWRGGSLGSLSATCDHFTVLGCTPTFMTPAHHYRGQRHASKVLRLHQITQCGAMSLVSRAHRCAAVLSRESRCSGVCRRHYPFGAGAPSLAALPLAAIAQLIPLVSGGEVVGRGASPLGREQHCARLLLVAACGRGPKGNRPHRGTGRGSSSVAVSPYARVVRNSSGSRQFLLGCHLRSWEPAATWPAKKVGSHHGWLQRTPHDAPCPSAEAWGNVAWGEVDPGILTQDRHPCNGKGLHREALEAPAKRLPGVPPLSVIVGAFHEPSLALITTRSSPGFRSFLPNPPCRETASRCEPSGTQDLSPHSAVVGADLSRAWMLAKTLA